MTIANFLIKVKEHPIEITFGETMKVMDDNFDFTPTSFVNGILKNEVGENNGSCKLFAFAKLYDLSVEQTLA